MHCHHKPPALMSASRTARCAALHRPARDFISMVMSLLLYTIQLSGRPGRTPRRLRIRPLIAEPATGSNADQNETAGSIHWSRR